MALTNKDTDRNTGTRRTAAGKDRQAAEGRTFKTRIGIPLSSQTRLTAILNQQLADNATLHSHTKQAHWNVKGTQFYELHLLFDRIAESIEGFTDEIAERITALGGTAFGTVQDAAQNTSFSPFPTETHDGRQYLMELRDRYAAYGDALRKASDECGELADPTSQDLLITITHPVDQALYFIEAFLQ
jgi:starvation-inducible DNA-binding protein